MDAKIAVDVYLMETMFLMILVTRKEKMNVALIMTKEEPNLLLLV